MVGDCLAVGTFLRQWRSHLDTVLSKENCRAHANTFSQALSISLHNARLHDFDRSEGWEHPQSKQRAAIVLSIKALLRAFYKILLQPRSFYRKGVVYGYNHANTGYFCTLVEPVRLLHDGSPGNTPPSAKVARVFLESHGRCPTHVQHLLLSEEIETVYMAAALRGGQ